MTLVPSRMRARLLLVLLTLTLPSPAAARRVRLHHHELVADIALAAAPEANAVFLEGLYRWSVRPISSGDPELPALRRFRLHPDGVYVRLLRDGDVNLGTTTLAAGGELTRGGLYLRGEVGVSLISVGHDGSEDGFVDLPLEVAGGLRGPSLQLGALAAFRPVLGATSDDSIFLSCSRDGESHDLGGELGGAVGERLLAALRLTWHVERYSFTGYDPGEVRADGPRARLDLVLPASETGAFVVRVDAARLDWDNRRLGESDRVDGDLRRVAYDVVGTVGYSFWFQGELAFTIAVGGGYLGARPLVSYDARPLGALRLGMVKRF